MSYIGNQIQNQNYVPAIDYFNGNGSTTAFTLSRPVASVAAVQAVINNVPQNPGDAFTVLNNTITFTSAPPSGTNNIYVYYTSPNTQVVQPGQGTVGPTQVDGNYALWNKSGSDINYTAGSVGVGTNSMLGKFNTYTSNAGNMANGIAMNNAGGGSGTGDSLTLMAGGTTITQLDWKYTSVFESSLSGRDNILFKTGVSPIERMRIDSSGRVTMPSQPAFHVTDASSTAVQQSEVVFLTANGTGFTFNNGSYYSTSTGRFTAPVAGKYMFTFTLRADSTTSYFHPQFKVNGGIVSNGQMIWGGALDYKSLCSSVIYSLSAGDYVSVTTQGSQNNTGALSPSSQQTFSGFLVC